MGTNTMTQVDPNKDKPHRCPKCHSIPDEARKDKLAIAGKTYSCDKCQIEWVVPKDYVGHWDVRKANKQ